VLKLVILKVQHTIITSQIHKIHIKKGKKVKADIALHGNPISELRELWDHTVLPATRHK